MLNEQQFLVDMFILEVGEGHMPSDDSPETTAYLQWREQQLRVEKTDETLRNIALNMSRPCSW